MKIYVPQKLSNLVSIFNENGCYSEIKHVEKYYYFLSKIATYKIFNKHKEKRHINKKYLRRIVGSRFDKRIIDTLLRLDIIFKDPSYRVGYYSQSYIISSNYLSKLVPIQVPSLERNIKVWSYFDVIDEDIEISNIISNKIIKSNCKLPYYDSFSALFSHFSEVLKEIKIQEKESREYIERTFEKNSERYFYYSDCVTFLVDGYIFKIIDSKTGRFYSNLTNLPKDLRRFLRYRGQELQELDIANSQPFLLNMVLNSIQNCSKMNINKADSYQSLTENGLIYDYFQNKLNITFNQERSRDEIKEVFFKKIFFCKNIMNYRYPESILFKQLFPEEFKVIMEVKKQNYKNLAVELQKMEANIIIYTICNKLSQQNVPIITIHDSILTIPVYQNIVKETILQEFENQYHLKPTIKIK